ncbi:hypothetical protein SLS60_004119 [Paraconiothyrium brasiliense]|uniref:Major facilitator superfamily (MFS) profile domain-containing protein n=1 Tax=Paraconiothyrium brasiliense TaxID=300254 RepID=A0ABR3RQS0_9PLEO
MSPDSAAPLPPPKDENVGQEHTIAFPELAHHAVSRPEHKVPSIPQSHASAPSPRPSPALKSAAYSAFPPSRNSSPAPGTPGFGPSRNGTPTPEPTGAAQFIANLSEKQRAHLQFAVPKADSDRLSHFLEEPPRKTPVPDRFTFEALDSEARSGRELNSKVRRGDTKKSSYSYKSVKSNGSKSNRSSKSSRSVSRSRHGRDESASAGRRTPGTPSTSRRVSFESMPKSRPHLKKEVRHFKGVALEVDWRFYATGICLALVNLVMAWDATAISIALPTIAVVLHGPSVNTFWLGISFLVAATAVIPLFSAFAEIFGRKAMLLAGLTLFIIGSLVTAIAGDMSTALLGRSIQGIGAGGVFVLSDLIITDLVSPLDKRRWSAVLGLVWAIGALTGPAIGEALAEQSQWRWIFWLNLPFCISSLLILAFFAKLKSTKYGSKLYELKQIDWVGFILMTGSLVAMLLGISWGGTTYAWSSPRTLIPIQFGFIGIVLYCVWSWFAPFQSMISIDGFIDPTSLGMYFGTTVQGAIIGAYVFFMPLYFGVADAGMRDVPAGVRWFPWTIPLAVVILFTFVVISRWNAWIYAIWLGWLLVMFGVAMTTFYTRTSSDGKWVSVAIVSGTGIGILFPSLHTASELIASRERDDERQRRAVTNSSYFHYLGKAFGVGLATCIFQNRLLHQLDASEIYHGFAKEYAVESVSLLVRIRATPGGPGSAKVQIADMYVESLKSVWTLMAVLAGIALLASCFMMPKVPKAEKEAEMKNIDGSYVV